jgi:hypothetical protein
MKTKLAGSLVFVLALSAQAFAQKGGKGGFGGEFGDRGGPTRPRWVNNMDSVAAPEDPFEARRRKMMGLDPAEKKYMLVYIRPQAETEDPAAFNSVDISKLSHDSFVFVKMDFDKDNAYQKGWGVKVAPMVIGCDLHTNEFIKTNAVSLDSLRRVVGGLPEVIARYETELKSDFAKANEAVKTDEPKAMKLFVKIVSDGKKGYKEVDESATKVHDYAEGALRKADLPESVSPEAGIDFLDEVSKIFKGTAPGVQADIRIARLDHDRGLAAKAIERLSPIIQKADPKLKSEVESAARALEDISKAGEAKVELAASGDRAIARETLKKLASDYKGTEAGKRALEAAKKFE